MVSEPGYRVGRHLGRTIYRVTGGQETLIGMMDTPEDGALVAEALNARERVLAAREVVPSDRDMSVPQMCQDSNGRPVDSGDCELNGPHYVTTLGVPHPRTPPSPSPTPVTCGRVGLHHCGITGSYHSHDSGIPLPEPVDTRLPSVRLLIGPSESMPEPPTGNYP